MNPPDESSLDRYLESQAGLMLSHASLRRGLMIMGAIGSMMLIVALLIVFAAVGSGQPAVMAGAIGPGIAGFVNLVLSRVLRARTKPGLEVNANLTPEARSFMANLMKEVYGWPRAWGAIEPKRIWESKDLNEFDRRQNKFERHRERHAWSRMIQSGSWGKRQRQSKECLQASAFDALDKAAFQYNRIAGALASGHPEMSRLAPTVKAAADQSMADMFHVGYLLDAYPESQSSAQAKADQEIAALTELANRLESIQQVPASQELALSKPSPIKSVLEELRLDQLARAELAKPQEEQRQDLNTGA